MFFPCSLHWLHIIINKLFIYYLFYFFYSPLYSSIEWRRKETLFMVLCDPKKRKIYTIKYILYLDTTTTKDFKSKL